MTAFEPLFSGDFEAALNVVIYGVYAVKLGGCGKPHVRRFFIDNNNMQELRWITPAKGRERSCVPLRSVESFSFGYRTKLFTKHELLLGKKPECALTISYVSSAAAKCELNIAFEDEITKQLFVIGLQYFILKEQCGLILSAQ